MPKKTEEEKRQGRFDRMLATAKQYRTTKYLHQFVAVKFQEMIRAEAGADGDWVTAIEDGKVVEAESPLGMCVCVTCCRLLAWSGGGDSNLNGMHAGHFLSSRRNSIILEETNCHPQCSGCNKDGGRPEAYGIYMLEVYGQEEIDRLRVLKHQVSRTFSLTELVELRIGYMDRIAAAKLTMSQ